MNPTTTLLQYFDGKPMELETFLHKNSDEPYIPAKLDHLKEYVIVDCNYLHTKHAKNITTFEYVFNDSSGVTYKVYLDEFLESWD